MAQRRLRCATVKKRKHASLALFLISALNFAVAQEQNLFAGGGAPMAFAIKSSAFQASAEIPKKFTCEGPDSSPQLEWSGSPAKTAGFALIVDDPDAPAGTWVHWVLWNLPAGAHSLSEGVAKTEAAGRWLAAGPQRLQKDRLQRAVPAAR